MKGQFSICAQFPMCDWPQMDRFIAVTHGERHVLRNRPLFDWFFLNHRRDMANVVVAYEGEKLISLLGYLPTTFRWGREEVAGAWMAHWMTLKEYRHGVGALLMKKMSEMFPVVAGQGASRMNQEIVTKLGFKFIERIPKVVYVFEHAKVQAAFGYREQPSAAPDLRDHQPARETVTITRERFDPDWELYPGLRFGTLRDAAYLSPRYIEYPFHKYDVFIEGEAHSPVVCVARLVVTTAGIKVARILELFFPETKVGRAQALALVRQCLVLYRRRGCDYADFYCNGATYIDLLLDVGFTHDATGTLPSLLDPIDMSRKFQNMELYVSSELKKRYPKCEDEFVVTRADGDQDRPNESYRYVPPASTQ